MSFFKSGNFLVLLISCLFQLSSRIPTGPIVDLVNPCCLPSFQHCISVLHFVINLISSFQLTNSLFSLSSWQLLQLLGIRTSIIIVFIVKPFNCFFFTGLFMLIILCLSFKDCITSFYLFENCKQTWNSIADCSIISISLGGNFLFVTSVDYFMHWISSQGFYFEWFFSIQRSLCLSISWHQDGFTISLAQSSRLYNLN